MRASVLSAIVVLRQSFANGPLSMQNPYGYGLLEPPLGFMLFLKWKARRTIRTVLTYLLRPLDVLGWRIKRIIWVKNRRGREVSDYRVIHAPRAVNLRDPGDDDFLHACPLTLLAELKIA